MFPIHAKCVTFDGGYEAEQKRAEEHLELGKIYTIRQMTVGQSSTHIEFYEIKGQWNSVFFDAAEEEIVAFRCTGKRFLPIFLVSFVVPRLALSLRPE